MNSGIRIFIISAQGLPDSKGRTEADPTCICEIPGKSHISIQTREVAGVKASRIIAGTVNVVWNHEEVVENYSSSDSLFFTVWEVHVRRRWLIGKAALSSEQIHPHGFDGFVDLTGVKLGFVARLQIRVQICGTWLLPARLYIESRHRHIDYITSTDQLDFLLQANGGHTALIDRLHELSGSSWQHLRCAVGNVKLLFYSGRLIISLSIYAETEDAAWAAHRDLSEVGGIASRLQEDIRSAVRGRRAFDVSIPLFCSEFQVDAPVPYGFAGTPRSSIEKNGLKITFVGLKERVHLKNWVTMPYRCCACEILNKPASQIKTRLVEGTMQKQHCEHWMELEWNQEYEIPDHMPTDVLEFQVLAAGVNMPLASHGREQLLQGWALLATSEFDAEGKEQDVPLSSPSHDTFAVLRVKLTIPKAVDEELSFVDTDGRRSFLRPSRHYLQWELAGHGSRWVDALLISEQLPGQFAVAGPFGKVLVSEPLPGAGQRQLMRRLLHIAQVLAVHVGGVAVDGLQEEEEDGFTAVSGDQVGTAVAAIRADDVARPLATDEQMHKLYDKYGVPELKESISMRTAGYAVAFDNAAVAEPATLDAVRRFRARAESLLEEAWLLTTALDLRGASGPNVATEPQSALVPRQFAGLAPVDTANGLIRVSIIKAINLVTVDTTNISQLYCVCSIVGKPNSEFRTHAAGSLPLDSDHSAAAKGDSVHAEKMEPKWVAQRRSALAWATGRPQRTRRSKKWQSTRQDDEENRENPLRDEEGKSASGGEDGRVAQNAADDDWQLSESDATDDVAHRTWEVAECENSESDMPAPAAADDCHVTSKVDNWDETQQVDVESNAASHLRDVRTDDLVQATTFVQPANTVLGSPLGEDDTRHDAEDSNEHAAWWNCADFIPGYAADDALKFVLHEQNAVGNEVVGKALLPCDHIYPEGFDGTVHLSCGGRIAVKVELVNKPLPNREVSGCVEQATLRACAQVAQVSTVTSVRLASRFDGRGVGGDRKSVV